MDTYHFIDYTCNKCGRCVEACPMNWLIISQFKLRGEIKRVVRGIDQEPPCDLCQEQICLKVCPQQAIKIESV